MVNSATLNMINFWNYIETSKLFLWRSKKRKPRDNTTYFRDIQKGSQEGYKKKRKGRMKPTTLNYTHNLVYNSTKSKNEPKIFAYQKYTCLPKTKDYKEM